MNDRPAYFMFQTVGNRFAMLVPPPDMPEKRRSCFPHNDGTAEQVMIAALEQIKADLAAGLESYQRVTVFAAGWPRVMRAQRSWSVCDAIGRELRQEPIDAAPIDYLEACQWPATPKATTRAQRERISGVAA